MKVSEAKALGERLVNLLVARRVDEAYATLAPYLSQKISFATLDKVGVVLGAGPIPIVNELLDKIVEDRLLGGWPIVGKALSQQVGRDSAGAFERCHGYILAGETWYAT